MLFSFADCCPCFAPQHLYHGSPKSALTELKPNFSSHQKEWVYAATAKHVAALFIGNWCDDDLQVSGKGTYFSPIIIREQYKGAFEQAFKNKSGSIYAVNTDGFSLRTGWHAERVSPNCTYIIYEEPIHDVYSYLEKKIAHNLPLLLRTLSYAHLQLYSTSYGTL